MNSYMIPKSILTNEDLGKKYYEERFAADYANMTDNPNYSESGCGISVTATDSEQTLSVKDPADDSKELCKMTFDKNKIRFTYSKPKMVDNVVNVGIGSEEKLNILDNNYDILSLNVTKIFGGISVGEVNTNSAIYSAIAYNNSNIVAIGSVDATKSDIFAYSSDGINWTQGTMPSSQQWQSVCYGKDKYIAIGGYSTATSAFAYSTDGINWTQGTLPSSQKWRCVCYGNDKFVAIANSTSTYAYSTDGINWTQGSLPSSSGYVSICYGNDKFVVISYMNDNSYYSTDGVNWSNDALSKYAEVMPYIWSICYGNGIFIVISGYTYGSNIFAYSTDGINWAMIKNSQSSHKWRSVCYGNGKFVAVATDGYISYSYNGFEWYNYASTTTEDNMMRGITYNPDLDVFITCGTRFCIIAIPDGFSKGTKETFCVKYSVSGEIPDFYTKPMNTSYLPGDTVTVDKTYVKGQKIFDKLEWESSIITGNNDYSWTSVCYGNGKFVAVADSNIYAYSTDGINWTQGTMPSNTSWRSVCYGNDKFVAIAYYSNVFAYSTDGINWTQGSLPSSEGYTSICYGNGKFVAVADSDVFAYSSDGINWTQGTLPSSQRWNSICCGNDKFVAIVTSSNIFAYSTDGINWTQGTLPSSQDWCSVCYGNGKFVAIVNDSNIYAYSTDGINWTQGTLPSSQDWYSVCYGNGKFVAIVFDFDVFAYSTDGINWTQGTLPSSQFWYSVCYGNGKFVAVVFDSDIIAYLIDSPTYYEFSGYTHPEDFNITEDTWQFASWYKYTMKKVAYTWTGAPDSVYKPDDAYYYRNDTVEVDTNYTSESIASEVDSSRIGDWDLSPMISNKDYDKVCYGNGIFVAIRSDSNYVNSCAYSTDGINWTESTMPTTGSWTYICYGNGVFVVAVRSGSTCAYSTDGKTWTQSSLSASQSWSCICYGNGTFVILASGQAYHYAYSTDGINWTEGQISSYGYNTDSLAYGNGKFVAIGTGYNAKRIAYSTDGITWTIENVLPLVFNLLQYGNGMFVAFYASGVNSNRYIYSSDAITWTEATLPSKQYWSKSYFLNGKFIITSGSIFAYSTDGINWTQDYVNTHPYSLCYGNGKYVGLSVTSSIYSSTYACDIINKYKFSGWDKSNFNITSDTTITGSWTPYLGEWVEITMPSSQAWKAMCYGNGKFVTIGSNSNAVAYSTDGINWTQGTLPSSRTWVSVCYGNGKYVAIAWYGDAAYSSDGITWTKSVMPYAEYWQSVCYGNGKFVAIISSSTNSDIYAYSPDGITWTQGTMPASANWNSVCYGNGKFISIDKTANSTIGAYSSDGITWTQTTVPAYNNGWEYMCYGNGKFVVVSPNGSGIMTSTDGITWTLGNISTNNPFWGITYGNGKFVIMQSYKACYYSSDAINWYTSEMPNSYNYIFYGNGKFIATNDSSTTTIAYNLQFDYDNGGGN